jgi:hypothetical protein
MPIKCEAMKEPDQSMSTQLQAQPIELKALAELADRVLQEEIRTTNPYLKAVMMRFSRVALELKAALESESRH